MHPTLALRPIGPNDYVVIDGGYVVGRVAGYSEKVGDCLLVCGYRVEVTHRPFRV